MGPRLPAGRHHDPQLRAPCVEQRRAGTDVGREHGVPARSELLRRAALLMVPLSERPSLHGRIAQWLEQGLEPRVPEALAGLLEYHRREARATQTTPQLEPLSLLTEP